MGPKDGIWYWPIPLDFMQPCDSSMDFGDTTAEKCVAEMRELVERDPQAKLL